MSTHPDEADICGLVRLTCDVAYSYRVDPSGVFCREWIIGDLPHVMAALPETADEQGCWAQITVEEDLPVLGDRLTCMRAGQSVVNDVRIRDAHGGLRWVRIYGSPVVDPVDGRLIRILGAVLDVTEHRRAEAERDEAIARLRTFAELSADWWWESDLEQRLTFVEGNHPFLPPRWQRGSIIGLRRDDYYDGVTVEPTITNVIQHQIEAGEGFDDLRQRLVFPGHPPMWISLSARAKRDADGRVIGHVGIGRDITQEVAREEHKLRSQRLEAVGQLTAGIAHDFNNLLHVILGNVDALAEAMPQDVEAQQAVSLIERAASRGAELTQRLLAFARRQPLHPMVFDMNDLVERMGPLLHRTVGEAITLQFVHDTSHADTLADPVQVEAALLNLALNARDAMPDGGVLTVGVSETDAVRQPDDERSDMDVAGRYTVLTVRDTGTGMPPDVLARAFEPFFTTKEIDKGTGLGLSMIYGFARQSGGHVELDSTWGAGTVVRVYLPKAQSVTAETNMPRDAQESSVGNATILLVEDDELVRTSVTAQFERLGYRVLAAEDGPAALRIIEDTTVAIDVMLTDVIMPGGISGPDLCADARRYRPSLPLILASGYPQGDLYDRHRSLTEMELLRKPYRLDELALALGRALREQPQKR